MDGAAWRVLDPLIEQGHLPNLARLRSRGAWARLNSTVPPLTPPGWTTGVTGKNPGKHNIFDFSRPDPRDYDLHLTTRLDRRVRAVWNCANEAGGKTLVMNVAQTFPPEEVDGALISGFGTPETDREYTWPRELKEKLLKKYPDFRPGIPVDFFQRGDWDGFLRELEKHTKLHWRIFTELYGEIDPAFAMYVFDEMDRLMHFFWHWQDPQHPSYKPGPYADAFKQHFQLVDALLGEFLERLPEDVTVAVYSDHGFGPVYSDIYLNNWLRDAGYITTSEGREVTVHTSTAIKIKAAIVSILEKLGVWRFYRDYRLKQAPVRTVWFLSHVDWARTKAVMHSMAGRSIRFNVRGRDAAGIVEPEHVDALAAQLEKQLLNLRNPETNEPIITRIWRGPDVYSGPCAKDAPDLILEPAAGYSFHHGFGDKMIMPSTQHGRIRSGDHEQFGIFMLGGPHVVHAEIEDMSLQDITPTLLHLMGLPVTADMDGRVVTEALADDWKQAHPVQSAEEAPWDVGRPTLSVEEDTEIAERLKALGYL